VVILQQNLPLFKRLGVPITLSSPFGDDLSAFLAFAIGIGARIERVFEH
jgi:hypothetical protein